MIQRHTTKWESITITRLAMLEEIEADLGHQVEAGQISEADAEAWLAARTEEIANSVY